MHTLRFIAPIPDMNGFAPLGGKQGNAAAMRQLYDSLPTAPDGAADISGADLLDAEGVEIASKDVLLGDVEKLLGQPLAVLMGRGRQALAEVEDGARFEDAFGFPTAA